ncbi:ATP-binding protein [Caulobacter sp. NIBR1757]|uniref:PAS domain-containing hybrid sensor histidine kinase/response regulator n=1 Tax=Caulobacter sp. NIBR1757 TaxID=3016000 RepID=UPI0022F0DA81|nr:ATP-binding protein [Caulobacter sp. NIBR1757]WGM40959.1 Sensor histidine kinase RcsC [Caulobacter sp. NIBR1757]
MKPLSSNEKIVALLSHLKRAQAVSRTGSWEWDLVTNEIFWSEEIYNIFGLCASRFKPSYPAILERLHPDDRDLIHAEVRAAIEHRKAYEFEHRVLLPDGGVRFVREHGEIEYGEDGAPVRMLGAVQDLTEVRRARSDALRSQEMLSSMMAISPEAIIVADARGRILLFSLGAEKVFGYSQAEAVGQDIEVLMPADVRGRHRGHVARFAAEGGRSLRMSDRGEISGQRKSGEIFPAEASLASLDWIDGQRFTVIVRDLSGHRLNERRLKEALEAAEQSNRAKSAFLANMSHEIRTPLNGVLGVAQALARTRLEEGQLEMLRLIETSGRALEQLLCDILDLAKVDAGRLAIARDPFDLGLLARDVHALFRATAADKGIGLRLSLDPAVGGIFEGDSLRIRQVLSNLISNAVKFTSEGEILVAVAPAARPDGAEAIRFQVSDSGIGFEADRAEQLFERFEQADNTTTRRFGGTGLGLAISRSLVELMGGTIRAEGRPGLGATFTVDLPLARVAENAILAGAEPATPTGGNGRVPRVLLAEDHPTNRRVVELILSGLPVELTSVENGLQALEATDGQPFDLILMDMQMPVMDGLTATRQIRAREARTGARRTRIVTLTANAMPEHRQASEAAGADGFLTKPIDAAALIEAVLDDPADAVEPSPAA